MAYRQTEMIKSMVHGKPTRRAQSAMYDVFTWLQPTPKPKQPKSDDQEQKPTEDQEFIFIQTEPKQQSHPNVPSIPPPTTEYQLPHKSSQKQKLKPHKIHNSLYTYEKVQIKKNSSLENIPLADHGCYHPASVAKLKLNEQDEKDRKIIEQRKDKIKQFNYFTRDLPNSAFTTYYGRPAFQSYGRCNSTSQLKTHNVMPHKGQNHPSVKQTYEGALLKAKHTKVSDHLPRKPIDQLDRKEPTKQNKDFVNLPIQKPDLINHIRFSEAKPTTDRKDPVPSREEISKRTKKQQSPRIQKNKKKKEDGLKFMNTREHLINLIEAKKERGTRLAYKVTQCYPESLEEPQQENQCPEERPAGVHSRVGDRAYNLIYRKY